MSFTKSRCQSKERIAKQTVLAMLNAPSVIGAKVGEVVYYTNPQGRTQPYRISAVESTQYILENGEVSITVDKTKVKTSTPSVLFDKLQSSQWTITSFDAQTRVVCIDIITSTGTHHTSITLPVLGFGGRDF